MQEIGVHSLGQEDSGGGNGNPFQYSCLENSMDRGAWQATVHEVAKSWTHLSTHTHKFLQVMDLFFFKFSKFLMKIAKLEMIKLHQMLWKAWFLTICLVSC